MKKLVVFTGAGMSADSGLSTFRDSDGLWVNRRVEDICTPEALVHNRADVIDFYNQRRRDALAAAPNAGHYAIAKLEKYFETYVITQNVDNLHERAGSTNVVHLHGELTKLCSSRNTEDFISIDGWEQTLAERHPAGSLLRPSIVFFGESVPMFDKAAKIADSYKIDHGDGLVTYSTDFYTDYADEIKEAMAYIDGRAEVEVSGNVTRENIARLTDLGVDFISSGALTHSSPILDLSLKNLHAI